MLTKTVGILIDRFNFAKLNSKIKINLLFITFKTH